jgi:DNA polymerase-3 subunit delta
MTDDLSCVTIIHGDNRAGMEAYIQSILAGLGDRTSVEMNTTRLNGSSAGENDLKNAALSIPFLTEYRVVILDLPAGLQTGGGKRSQAEISETNSKTEMLLSVLNVTPESTRFLIVLDDTHKRRPINGVWQDSWDVLKENHPLRKWVSESGGKGKILSFALPDAREMPAWIQKEAERLGGNFAPQAAHLLAQMTGSDTLVARQEIEKLLILAGNERAVEAGDVEAVSISVATNSIFEFTDALGTRNGKLAQRVYHRLLESADAGEILASVIRHFRQLLMAREVLDQKGSTQTVARELGTQEFIARKLTEQAGHFRLSELVRLYKHLIEVDEGSRGSGMETSVALDKLILQISTKN